MVTVKIVKVALYPFRSIVGSGLGNKKIIKNLYKWYVSKMIPEQSTTIDVGGYELYFNIGGRNGLDALAAGLMFGNGYEIEMSKLFKSVVKPGMNVVDVGAHMGYYTIMASKLVGEHGKVWGFEPEPRNYASLLKNIELNQSGNIIAINQALGSQKSKVQLYITEQLPGEATIVDIKKRLNHSIQVDMVDMDSVLKDERVDIIKVDVDGGEVGVLKGSQKVLKNNPHLKLFTEVMKEALKDAGYSCKEYWDMLKICGFTYIYLINERTKIVSLIEYDDMMYYMKTSDGVNLLCSKDRISIPFEGLISQKALRQLPKRVGKRIKAYSSVLKENENVLDVGCGIGTYVEKLLVNHPIQIDAVDKDRDSIEYAKLHNNGNGNINYILADAETYKSDKKYDAIICSQVLEHIRNPKIMLENIRDLIKDEGVLCVGVPNGHGCFEVENIIPRLMIKTKYGKQFIDNYRHKNPKDSMSDDSPHVNFFSQKDVIRLLNESGWTIDKFVNEELLGGVITDRLFLQNDTFARWNIGIAEKLPSNMANGWIIICHKNINWKPYSLKEEVKRFWDTEPCGTGDVNGEAGTKEFYEALSERRYRLEPLVDKIAEFNKSKGKQLLEVGCGAGCDLVRFAQSGADVTGIDLSNESVKLAQKRLELYGLKGKAIEADVESLPFENNKFDIVYSYGVIHHTQYPEKGIKEIYRVLKPNGEVRVALYNKRSLVALELYLLFGLFKLKPFRNIDDILWKHHESIGTKAYTIKQLRDMFSMFRNVEICPLVSLHDIRFGMGKYLPRGFMNVFPKNYAWLIGVKGVK